MRMKWDRNPIESEDLRGREEMRESFLHGPLSVVLNTCGRGFHFLLYLCTRTEAGRVDRFESRKQRLQGILQNIKKREKELFSLLSLSLVQG